MQDSLAKRLRVLRAERGLTLREAGSLAGVRPGTLSDIEHGRSRPHALTLAKIATAYSVAVGELLEEPRDPQTGKATAPQEYSVPVEEQLEALEDMDELAEQGALEEPGDPQTEKVEEALDTGLATLSPAELESRVFGAPVRGGEEPTPVIDAAEADALVRQAREERDVLGGWLEKYARAPSPTRFAARATAEEIEEGALRAQVYWLFLIDVWSKLADPRGVPFRGVLQLGGLATETFDAARARVEARDRARRTEGRAG